MTARPEIDIDEAFARGTPIDEAVVEAQQAAIALHRQAGLPLAVWKDGKAIWMSADEVEQEIRRQADVPNQ